MGNTSYAEYRRITPSGPSHLCSPVAGASRAHERRFSTYRPDPFCRATSVLRRHACIRDSHFSELIEDFVGKPQGRTRPEDRSENLAPNRTDEVLKIGTDTGILCSASTGNPLRDKTWLLVRVAREDLAAAVAQDSAQTLAALMDSFAGSLSTSDSTIYGITDAVKAVMEKALRDRFLGKDNSISTENSK